MLHVIKVVMECVEVLSKIGLNLDGTPTSGYAARFKRDTSQQEKVQKEVGNKDYIKVRCATKPQYTCLTIPNYSSVPKEVVY